jgi:hypothetical protein
MAEALEQVVELFRAKDWKFEIDDENDLVRTGIQGENGDWQVMAAASENDPAFLMLSFFPQKCPARRRVPCAELLTRINFGMMVGCFEMDYDSGRIHFKTTLPFTQGALDPEVLNNIVMFNLAGMDRFLPAIMSVIYAGTSPAKALAAVDRDKKGKPGSRTKKATNQQELVRRRFLFN